MQRKILIASLILAPLNTGAALARSSFTRPGASKDVQCFVSVSQWKSTLALEQLAVANAWLIKSIKIDDGCYELKGWDDSGQEFEAKFDPQTLEIVQFEFEDFDERDDNQDLKPTEVE